MKKIILILTLALPAVSHAQTFSLPWYRISGGGGTSSGGNFQVTGTIGQAEAGPAMTGGNFSLTGGFWSIISVVQTPGLPTLSVSRSGNSVTVSWPTTGSYSLQQNNNLAVPAAWGTSGFSVNTSNGTNSITVTNPTGNLFFRLTAP